MPSKILILFALMAFFLLARTTFAGNPTPRPTRLPTPLPGGGMAPAWMTPPAPGTTQADTGAVIYYYRCMACHGDKQQGLTVEWRAQWDVEHQDCARSTCHGARHPPEGFTFPKNFAPALAGTNTLDKYQNAQELFDFIHARMPYQAPGSLSGAEYWELVAFLLARRGVKVTQVDEKNARQIPLEPPAAAEMTVPMLLGAGGLGAAGLATLVLIERKRKKSPPT